MIIQHMTHHSLGDPYSSLRYNVRMELEFTRYVSSCLFPGIKIEDPKPEYFCQQSLLPLKDLLGVYDFSVLREAMIKSSIENIKNNDMDTIIMIWETIWRDQLRSMVYTRYPYERIFKSALYLCLEKNKKKCVTDIKHSYKPALHSLESAIDGKIRVLNRQYENSGNDELFLLKEFLSDYDKYIRNHHIKIRRKVMKEEINKCLIM